MIKNTAFIVILITFAGCAGYQNGTSAPEVVKAPVPQDYIIEPEISIDQAIGPIKQQKPDYVVNFSKGAPELKSTEMEKLEKWLSSVTKDNRIIVHGAAGPIKYRAIGEARAMVVLEYLQSMNYTVVLVPYDEKLPGMRAQLWALKPDSNPAILNSLLALTVFPLTHD